MEGILRSCKREEKQLLPKVYKAERRKTTTCHYRFGLFCDTSGGSGGYEELECKEGIGLPATPVPLVLKAVVSAGCERVTRSSAAATACL